MTSFRPIALLLLLLTTPLFGATKTWTGAGGNALWSNGANWSGGVAPANGDDVVVGASSTNDLSALSINSLSFSGAITLSGNTLSLGAGGMTGDTVNNVTATVGFSIVLTAVQTWAFKASFCSGTIVLQGDISGTGPLTITSHAAETDVNGHLNISGLLTLGPGYIHLNNSNSFPTPLTIASKNVNEPGCITFRWDGVITPTAAGAIPAGVGIEFAAGSRDELDIIGQSVTVSSLRSLAAVVQSIEMSNGSLTIAGASGENFAGFLNGTGTLTVASGTQSFSYPTCVFCTALTFSGSINVTGGALLLNHVGFAYAPTASVTNAGRLLLNQSGVGDLSVSSGKLQVASDLDTRYSYAPSSVHSLTLTPAATYEVSLASLPTQYPAVTVPDLDASGTISLGNSTLVVNVPTPLPASGNVHSIIRNSGSSPVNGTFAGLPEGAAFVSGGYAFRISYHGGNSGKDVTLTVGAPPTQTSLSSLPNPSFVGQPVTLTATVTTLAGFSPAGGGVTFYDGANTIGTATADNSGNASITTSTLTLGTHSLSATYAGNASVAGSTSPVVSHVVAITSTETTLTVSPTPSHETEPVILTATVQASGGFPQGIVNFLDNGSNLGSATLGNDQHATIVVTTLTLGTHTLSASYAGTPSFSPSNSLPVTHEVRPLAGCLPAITTPPADTVVTPHSAAVLTVATSGAFPQNFAWYRGTYPDSSHLLASGSSTLILNDLMSSMDVWLLVSNDCGSAHASARVTAVPPRRRGIRH
jgi:hypothetical protein